MALKAEDNMPHNFLYAFQNNTKNIFAKFNENIWKLSQEIVKNTTNLPPPSRSKTPETQNSPKQRAISPIRVFSLTSIRVLPRIHV